MFRLSTHAIVNYFCLFGETVFQHSYLKTFSSFRRWLVSLRLCAPFINLFKILNFIHKHFPKEMNKELVISFRNIVLYEICLKANLLFLSFYATFSL